MRTRVPKLFALINLWLLRGTDRTNVTLADGTKAKIPLVVQYDEEEWGFFHDTKNRKINDCVHVKVVEEHGAESASFEYFRNGRDLFVPYGTSTVYTNGNRQYGRAQWWHTVVPDLWMVDFYERPKSFPALRGWSLEYCVESVQVKDPVIGRYVYKYRLGSSLNKRPIIRILEAIGIDVSPTSKCKVYTSRYQVTLSPDGVVINHYGPRSHSFAGSLPSDILPWEVYYDTKEEIVPLIETILTTVARGLVDQFSGDLPKDSSSQTQSIQVVQEPINHDSVEDLFLFNEFNVRIAGLPYIGVTGYWYNWLTQHAYLAACKSVPTLNDNSISNLLEIVGFIKSLVIDRKIEFPTRLQDLWLQYRYVYKTTELDVKEAIKFAKRYMSLGTLNKELKCYGDAQTTVQGITVDCKCCFSITPNEVGNVERIWNALQTYGLTPDFYVIWDMIPYSFIVDWFIPVGDMLDVLDSSSVFRPGERYDIKDVCFSLSYRIRTPMYTYKVYSRWASDPPQSLNGYYWLESAGPSDKVVTMRVLDALSLTIS